MRLVPFATLALTLILATVGCGSGADIVWPLSGSSERDADVIGAPFGPRLQSDDYDFHAGTDFPTPEGTKVRAIKAGVVEKLEEWDGGTGSGNWVLIDHGDGEKSGYLHLSKFSVKAGDAVEAGTVLGRSGSTGSKSPHLHLNYMLDVDHKGADEARGHNVLELLPHAEAPALEPEFTDVAVTLHLSIQIMTIQTITVEGEGQSRTVDYAEILAMGNPDRDDPTQAGLTMAVIETDDGRFTLTLTPEPPGFTPERVTVSDIDGELLVFERAP
jgi:murein DD-endopeptidase MepM/ murein hydrolase activator NlpD